MGFFSLLNGNKMGSTKLINNDSGRNIQQTINLYRKNYLNAIVNGHKIINVGKINFNNKLIAFLDAKCCKCSRVQRVANIEDIYACACFGRRKSKKSTIKYRKDDIRKILSEKKSEKELVDDLWDAKIIPSKIYIRDNTSNESFIKTFGGGYSVYPTNVSYFLKKNKLTGMGLNKIKEINTSYFIGDYLYYTYPNGYIKYRNVYKNFDNVFEPIIYYIHNNEEIDPNSKILNSYDMSELRYVYFEKEKDFFNLYNYKNNKLVNKICKISKVIRKDKLGYLLKFKDGVEGFYSIIDDEIYESTEFGGTFEKVYEFNELNANLSLNISELNENFRNKIEGIVKNDNTLNKTIYVTKNEKISNIVLFKYLTDNFQLKKVYNEFDDDKSEIYCVNVDRKNKKAISFLEYLSIIKKADDYKYKVYGIDINSIVGTFFLKYNFKKKLCDLIKKGIIKLDNEKLKDTYISFIFNYCPDINNVNMQICKKMKEKYKVDDLELFLILLYKYGEENVFNIPNIENKVLNMKDNSISIVYKCDNDENKELYNQAICEIDSDEIKWKSEHKLYKLLKSYFSDAIFQYRDAFLDKQSLDIYIPSLRIAFEYQGLQHFEAVEYFGGEEEFSVRQKNDKRKKELCKKNKIDLIEWRYDEDINKIMLDKKLYPFKSKIRNLYMFSEIDVL